MIIQRFNLNLIPNQSPVIVHVNQYDTGTGRLVATLYEGNEPYSPNGTAVIQGTKPDGHGFQYTATLDGNVVTADLTEQMSPVAGDVRVQIVVTESSGVTGTFVFIMRVQPSALPSDTEMSESDYQYIEEAIREAQEAVQTAQEATETAQEAVERAEAAITETQENAEDSEAWAQGTRSGIPVDPTDPTYEHNAEYWAQYAERYAQGGLHYKGSILFADIPTTGMREGDMYNITDDFTTDSRFEEEAGIEVKGGTNIAWNSDNKWDVLALPPKTTFNGRSGSILPMAGDYDSKKILLSSALHIGGETQNDVQEALEALSNDGVKSFNGRSGSILPMAGDYDSEKILLASVLHIGGETQNDVQEALEALSDDGVKSFNGRNGSILPMAGDYDSKKILLSSALHIGGETQNDVQEALEALENNKADKVDNATADNFAGLDANGNLKDSGKKASDFATPSDIAGQQSLLEDTVGWTGKDLLKNTATNKTGGNVAWVVNADKSITINTSESASSVQTLHIGEVTGLQGDYILNGVTGGSMSTYGIQLYDVTTSTWITQYAVDGDSTINLADKNHTYRFVAYVRQGVSVSNITIYPMLRRADITDPTYEPYHESVEVMYEEEIHGVNLLKNIATSKTVNGVTFTVNADGSVTANGTATAFAGFTIARHSDKDSFNYEGYIGKALILSGCPANGSMSSYKLRYDRVVSDYSDDYGEGLLIVPDANYVDSWFIEIAISSGVTVNNLVFKPMLRLATIEDSAYRPYNPQAIQNQLNDKGVLGAKNLLKNNATSQTINGVTFTVNSDGSITANGTASAIAFLPIVPNNTMTIKKGSYILSAGDGIIGNYNKYGLYINGASGDIANTRIEERTHFSLSADILVNECKIFVTSGTTVSNLTFYPMIRLASDPDDTYQPYAMTNRELTEKVTEASTMEYIPTGANLNDYYRVGEYAVNTSSVTQSLINKPNDLSLAFQLRVVVRGHRDIGEGSSNANVTQIIECINGQPGTIYMRTKAYNESWSSWYKFTGTVVS